MFKNYNSFECICTIFQVNSIKNGPTIPTMSKTCPYWEIVRFIFLVNQGYITRMYDLKDLLLHQTGG